MSASRMEHPSSAIRTVFLRGGVEPAEDTAAAEGVAAGELVCDFGGAVLAAAADSFAADGAGVG